VPSFQTNRILSTVVSRVPAIAVVLAAAGAFWLLGMGGAKARIKAHAYAEVINHEFGPLHAGRIESIKVKLGQKVKAGDVLATMDRRALEAKRDVIKAQLAQARSKVQAERHQAEMAIIRNEILVLRARANARESRAEVDELSRQLKRLEGLATDQLVRQTEIDERRRRQQNLVARASTFEEGATRGQGAIKGAVAGGMRRATQIAELVGPYEEAVQAKAASLREAEILIEECVVRARVDGTVASLLKEQGEVVTAGTGLVRVVTARPGMVVAWLTTRQVREVTLGRKATVRRARLLGPSFAGEVVEIGPEVEELPPQVRTAPNARSWGRRITIAVKDGVDLLPGEELGVNL
jgi:HlyD family secretion protein